ncbi:MAG: DUF1553 domain-containing protein [Planctomycetaceae bacterium]|nr:DUF1553 domain-containing protein [Planctomycetaceae bacterium]
MSPIHGLTTLLTLGALLASVRSEAADPAPEDREFFENKVRPLLVQHCSKCHGEKKQEAGLRLDSRAAVLKGGDSGPALEAGKPDESLLVEAVGYAGDIKMPPKGKLTDDEISALTEWVLRGAVWPPDPDAGISAKGEFDLQARKAKQWALQPIGPQTPPVVQNSTWPRSPADRFILSKLEAAGLKPAVTADKRTLLRRVTFDLIGLPPTPAELEAYLGDASPRAFDSVVDRLLDSPHYGERWGRHWLDLVRYAETAGHEFDFEIPYASEYRDYVVRAFNADLPYDRFVIEHLAGDLLTKPRTNPTEGFNESIIGTGFWFLGESKHSPVDVRADEADRLDNQIDVFGKVFLGQTLGCARCHDHKFDALSTNDYYAFKGYLQSSRRQIACIDAGDEITAIVTQLETLSDERAALLRDSLPPPVKSTAGSLADSDVRFVDFATDTYRDWFVSGDAFGTSPVTDPTRVLSQPGRGWPVGATGLAHSGVLAGRLEGVLRSPTFTIPSSHILYLAAGKGTRIQLIVDSLHYLQNPIYGGLKIALDNPDRVQWFSQDVSKWIGHNAYIEVVDDGEGFAALEQIVFSSRGSPPFEPAAAGEPVPPAALAPKLAAIAQRQNECEGKIRYRRKALAMTDGSGEDDHVHLRGNANKFGDIVPRRFLEALAGADQPAVTKGSGRLELARRVVDESNPLLPRVIVNRLWKHHFGEGLVRTPDDFGNMGQPPTHPELLDWLASELMSAPPPAKGEPGGEDRPWSLKRIHRLLLLSSTYQMSSLPDDRHAEELDPQNKLWHRMNLRRLEAEIIRDAMLVVSGRLDRRLAGGSVRPYLTPFMVGRGRPVDSGPLDGDGRRSLYLSVRRNFLTPMFLAFDYPVPFATIGRRSVSNVPAQALALMNNPFVVQQAEVWANRVIVEHQTPDARLDAMYLAAFARVPTAAERDSALAFVNEQSRQYPAGEAAHPWTDLAHVLLNVKEFIFVD